MASWALTLPSLMTPHAAQVSSTHICAKQEAKKSNEQVKNTENSITPSKVREQANTDAAWWWGRGGGGRERL